MKKALSLVLLLTGVASVSAGVHVRESVEWEHAWMDGTDDTSLPRVLLVGDSVCNAYQGEVRSRLAGVARVDYWASSKCLTDRTYWTALKYHLDEARYQVVHFNNGLHSLGPTTNPKAWADCLRDAFRLIRARGRGAAIVWASSTPLRDDPKLGPVVSKLNALARPIAAEEGVEVNDLFALMDPLPRETFWSDQYHYKPAGVAKQADQIASVVKAALAKAKPLPVRGIGAHRGDCRAFPENTVPAIASAAKKGAQMVEFDVKRCKTGELVVIHDETVDRTTDGHGVVTNMTFAELRALDAGKKKDARFAGTRIPTFDEAIDCVPRDGVWINVHCDVGAGVAAECARGIRAKRRQHQAFISCELPDARAARRVVPEILVCNMTRTGPWGRPWTAKESRDYALDTVSAGCDFLQLIAPATASDMEPVHAAGGKVSYFYTDDPARARQLFKDGSDFVLTNNLDPMLAAFGAVPDVATAQDSAAILKPSDAPHLGLVPVSGTLNAGLKVKAGAGRDAPPTTAAGAGRDAPPTTAARAGRDAPPTGAGDVTGASRPGGVVVQAADFGVAATNLQNAAALNRALAHCRAVKAACLVLPANASLRCEDAESVALKGLKNFTLDGAGSELVTVGKGSATAVLVEDCVGVTVRNLGIDSGRPMGEGICCLRSTGVRVEGCRFDDPPFLMGRVRSGADIVFSGNTVNLGGRGHGVREWAGSIAIEDVANVVVEKGVYHGVRKGCEPVVECFRTRAASTAVRDNTIDVIEMVDADETWEVFGSFGKARGQARTTKDGFRFDGPGYVLETTVETEGDVSLRKTVLKNVSEKPLTANCLMDRFPLDEGDWEVYTQSSYWENESKGRWHDLTTAVEVRNPNMRSGHGAAPMLAVRNRQTGRGRVFHLLTDSAYELHAVRSNPGGNQTTVAVEVGMDPRQLAYVLKPGESVALPQVLSYEFQNRTDLDCHKLHAWWHRHYPGRRPPAIYNTWLCRFDKLDADFLLKQVARAKDLGMEYFVIDAGWFGPAKDWGSIRGEWVERPNGYLKGRMAEVSAAARKAGMKFGFWVEAESVMGGSKVAKEHPEWLLKDNCAFLDFENPQAFNYIVETVCALLKKYEASYLKFDFNQNLDHDATGRAFTAYNAAYRRFVQEIRRRNPGIYIEGCASGGYMMDLGWAREFDGFWLSDNQSPRHGMRIVKETMLRLPPQKIERWIVARTAENLQPDYGGRDSRLLATEDATWTHALTYSPSYIDAFAAGGPYSFSCDLTAFSAEHFKHFADVIAQRRADGAFWQKAVGRILCDTKNLTVFQYSDEALSEIRVVAVSDILAQRSVRVYPVLAPDCVYQVNGETRSAADIAHTGIEVPISSREGRELVLKRR